MLTFVPAGMERVSTFAPERPLTLQVRSVEVTSVTGLLLGGTRIKLFCPSSVYTSGVSDNDTSMEPILLTAPSQMYCIVT